MTNDVVSKLATVIPPSRISTDPSLLDELSWDALSEGRIHPGHYPELHAPVCAVRPRSTDEVRRIVQFANAEKIALVPFGGGSGLMGGAMSIRPGVAVDLRDPEFSDPAYRQANFHHIQEVVEVFFLLQTADEAYHDGQARGLPIGTINSPDDLLHDEHLLARDFFVTVEHDDTPAALYPGAPFRFSNFGPAPMTRAPKLGEHTAEVLGAQKVGGRQQGGQ